MTYTVKQKFLKSFDGTRIGYQLVGKGKKPFVLCNGLGGNTITWTPLYEAFGDRFTFLTWDYRGLYTSDYPEDPKSLAIPYHVKDLEAILKKEKIKKTSFGGWSMGVQVCLEYYRNHASQYQGMFLLNGTSGYPFDTALNAPLTKYLIPQINKVITAFLPALQPRIRPLAKHVINHKDFINIIVKLGLVREGLNSDVFRQVAHGLMESQLHHLHEILDHLGKHDASDVLTQITVPTLIIAGHHDILTPSSTAEFMAKKIPNAEFFVVNNGSHYSLLEYPDLINKRLEQFFKEHKLL